MDIEAGKRYRVVIETGEVDVYFEATVLTVDDEDGIRFDNGVRVGQYNFLATFDDVENPLWDFDDRFPEARA